MKNNNRGVLTDEIKGKYNITKKELRLMPYLQYLLVNNLSVDPSKIDREEREILQKWRDEGKITFSTRELCTITKEFWNKICDIIFDGYVPEKISDVSENVESYYRYVVSYSKFGYGSEKTFNTLKEAGEFALKKYEEASAASGTRDTLIIKENEYSSKSNFEKHLTLYSSIIWNSNFHTDEDLRILAGVSDKDGTGRTYNGKIISMKEYAMMCEKRSERE